MPRLIYLDSGPLGLGCNPKPDESRTSGEFQKWLALAIQRHIRVIIPATADYEVRRELIRSGSRDSIAKLDAIETGRHPDFPGVAYLPLSDAALKRAAGMWAEARNRGYATAGAHSLDGDVLVIAQVLEDMGGASRFTIATGNVGDLARYVGTQRARLWMDIIP